MFQHRSFSNAMAAPPTSGQRFLTRSINNLVHRECDDVTALPSSIRLHQRHDKGSNFGECERSKAAVFEFSIISRELLELRSSDKLHCVVVWSVREIVDPPLLSLLKSECFCANIIIFCVAGFHDAKDRRRQSFADCRCALRVFKIKLEVCALCTTQS